MKKSKKISLDLNKKTISNFKMGTVTGGSGGTPDTCQLSLIGTCRSNQTCFC